MWWEAALRTWCKENRSRTGKKAIYRAVNLISGRRVEIRAEYVYKCQFTCGEKSFIIRERGVSTSLTGIIIGKHQKSLVSTVGKKQPNKSEPQRPARLHVKSSSFGKRRPQRRLVFCPSASKPALSSNLLPSWQDSKHVSDSTLIHPSTPGYSTPSPYRTSKSASSWLCLSSLLLSGSDAPPPPAWRGDRTWHYGNQTSFDWRQCHTRCCGERERHWMFFWRSSVRVHPVDCQGRDSEEQTRRLFGAEMVCNPPTIPIAYVSIGALFTYPPRLPEHRYPPSRARSSNTVRIYFVLPCHPFRRILYFSRPAYHYGFPTYAGAGPPSWPTKARGA
ncbi:hypothetical protein FB45DRAFT_998081 [Roridomyces roridus]|uniref:Uncharacterized protein n=1 Tax=Roridomyces roridus TaxID=1738132 RepID=A0AAD7FZS2_9AGAR|nr:hypothetical protein FB45DRAFT_998081 [Roridomyces roridus]